MTTGPILILRRSPRTAHQAGTGQARLAGDWRWKPPLRQLEVPNYRDVASLGPSDLVNSDAGVDGQLALTRLGRPRDGALQPFILLCAIHNSAWDSS